MAAGFFRRRGKRAAGRTQGSGGPFQRPRAIEAEIAEMLGVIRRVLADGVVSEEEAQALAVWVEGHPSAVAAWPGKVLVHRLRKIFQDGRVDEGEREQLARLLRALASGSWGVRTPEETPSGIPYTRPPPLIVFPESTFAFVGDFAYGPPAALRKAVEDLGGRVAPGVGPDVHVVVVGTFGERDWRSTPAGEAISEALRLQGEGRPIRIVSEEYWVSCLPET